MKLSSIIIDRNERALVIPEIGINHNGNIDVAKQMVDAAHRSGARIIKHQTHIIEDEMCSEAKKIIPGNANISIYEVMRRAALSEENEKELMRYTESLGMFFLSTPFSRAAADRLEKFGVGAYKIGSGELNNYPLIEHIASFGKPMIVSTGMNNVEKIEKAVNILEKKNVDYALLHTTNLYPCPAHLVRLGGMKKLMDVFPNVIVGLSDHTVNNNACIAAIAMGAKIVERHFVDTYDRKGPDVCCSMDEKALKELLSASKEIFEMENGEKCAAKEEQVTIDFAFASVVTIKPIKKGEVFTKDNIWVKRPGTGDFLAEEYESILGKTAKEDIAKDVMLKKEWV